MFILVLVGVFFLGLGLLIIIYFVVNIILVIEVVFCRVEWVIFVGLIILVINRLINLLFVVLKLVLKFFFFIFLLIIVLFWLVFFVMCLSGVNKVWLIIKVLVNFLDCKFWFV